MNAAKCCVDASFDETKAIQVSREIWANREDSQLIQQQISAEHYTPAQYIAAAHRVLGTIDLDPASCSEANKIIKATKFFDEKIDGLAQEWRGRIWLNPPYCGLSGPFVEKLCAEYIAENVTAAIVLVIAPTQNGSSCSGTFRFASRTIVSISTVMANEAVQRMATHSPI
jgi:ParB family chromosome partitioning protein